MSTPGIRKALKALAATKKKNARRVARGEPAVIAGKKIAPATYKRKYSGKKP